MLAVDDVPAEHQGEDHRDRGAGGTPGALGKFEGALGKRGRRLGGGHGLFFVMEFLLHGRFNWFPQGLKPRLVCSVYVRANARTVHRLRIFKKAGPSTPHSLRSRSLRMT